MFSDYLVSWIQSPYVYRLEPAHRSHNVPLKEGEKGDVLTLEK